MTWQPIETAPPNVRVLIRVERTFFGTQARVATLSHEVSDAPWFDDNGHRMWSASPTHWQPLPGTEVES